MEIMVSDRDLLKSTFYGCKVTAISIESRQHSLVALINITGGFDFSLLYFHGSEHADWAMRSSKSLRWPSSTQWWSQSAIFLNDLPWSVQHMHEPRLQWSLASLQFSPVAFSILVAWQVRRSVAGFLWRPWTGEMVVEGWMWKDWLQLQQECIFSLIL